MPDNHPSSESGPKKTPFIPSLRRLLQLSGRYRALFYSALVVDLGLSVLVIVQNDLFRRMFDSVTGQNHTKLLTLTILVLITFAVNIPLSYLRTRSLGTFSENTLANIRSRLAVRFNLLPVSYLEERHSGDFLSVVNADIGKVKNLTGGDLLALVGQVTRGLAALVYIFLISWQLTLVALVLTPLMFVVLAKLSSPITKRADEMQGEIGNLNSVAQDGLNGLPITKSFNLVSVLDERYEAVNKNVIQKGLSLAKLRSGIDSLSGVIGFTPFLIALGYGGYLAITGKITFGSIFAFINLLNFVVNPLSQIPRLVGSISESVGASQRIFESLDHEVERGDGIVREPARVEGPIIRIQDLNFAYEPETPVLQGINLEVKAGEKIAIVGPSGSGKSTLIKVLLGFYPVEDQRVFLYGEDLNRWQLSAARQQMGFVAQDTYLFPVSIEENIAGGKLGASQTQIEQAAAAANLVEFIQTLPEGYRSMVGERGTRLSGGQKQRISLARVFLKDAPILLLDEPTSALDSESEALVQGALDRFMAGHTSLIIAHRLSTIKNADRVLVIDNGRIVEQGTHEALLQKGGLYQDLYERQFGLEQAPVNKPALPDQAGGSR
jgi:ABC-type multidrug transport system fused ATPase/permease subunit